MAPKYCATWREREANFKASHTHALHVGALVTAWVALEKGNRNSYNTPATLAKLCMQHTEKKLITVIKCQNIKDKQNEN